YIRDKSEKVRSASPYLSAQQARSTYLFPRNGLVMNQNNRKSNFYPIICCLLITWLFIYTSNAQLTFSKGWKIGKRTEDEPDSQIKISANAICHFLV
uniref:Uncharacterized protein LOC114347144 n=1 Tax=Diabrotica virgifera virgifera TaxID=50390 RepID=A0A6P7GVZ5_DIAVI